VPRIAASVATYALLALAGGFSFAMPETLTVPSAASAGIAPAHPLTACEVLARQARADDEAPASPPRGAAGPAR
jgi:hypothetical protein